MGQHGPTILQEAGNKQYQQVVPPTFQEDTFTMTLVKAADHNKHHSMYKNGAWSQWTDWASEVISKGQSSTLTTAQFDALKNGFAYAEGTKDIISKLAKTGHSFRLAAGSVVEIFQNGQLVESIASQVKPNALLRYTKRYFPKIPGAVGAIFIIGAGGSALANGGGGDKVLEAMGREAIGADLIESGFRMVIVDAGTPVYNYVVDPGGVISRRSGPLTDQERAEQQQTVPPTCQATLGKRQQTVPPTFQYLQHA